jgi:hypothetical protein
MRRNNRGKVLQSAHMAKGRESMLNYTSLSYKEPSLINDRSRPRYGLSNPNIFEKNGTLRGLGQAGLDILFEQNDCYKEDIELNIRDQFRLITQENIRTETILIAETHRRSVEGKDSTQPVTFAPSSTNRPK